MSLALKIKPLPIGGESGKYDKVVKQHKGLLNITRQWEVEGSAKQSAEWLLEEAKSLFDAYGTKDGETTNTSFNKPPDGQRYVFPNVYLEEQGVQSQSPNSSSAILTKVYQEAYETLREIKKPITSTDSMDRGATKRTFVVLNGSASIDEEVGAVDPDDESQVFIKQVVEEGNAVSIVTREYLEATDEFLPSGGDKTIVLSNGIKVCERTLIAKAGTEFNEIVGVSTYGGKVLQQYEESTNEAYSSVVARYSDSGILSKSEDYVGSQLGIIIETLGEVPQIPGGYSFAKSQVSNFEGFKTIRYSFLKSGVIMSLSKKSLADGVQQVTTQFFETEGVTVGPIISRSISDYEGIPTFTVVTLQDSEGNSIVEGGENLANQVSGFSSFSYPGVLDVDVEIKESGRGNQRLLGEVHLLTAPAQCKVKTTTYYIFQNYSSSSESDHTYAGAEGLWSPNHWASVFVDAEGEFDDGTFTTSRAYRGYRTSSSSQSGTIESEVLSLAELVWQGTSRIFDNTVINYEIDIDQGPPDPIGKSYTLDIRVSPAFDDVDGNKYYKKTIIVTDPIPAQPKAASLPYV